MTMPWFEDDIMNAELAGPSRMFAEGIAARVKGEPESKDPYAGAAESLEWHRGWMSADGSIKKLDGVRDQSMKKDAGKPRMELIDWGFVEETARVLGFGAVKYEANGWRKGMAVTRVIGSMFRHMIAFAMGQDKDPESGLSHLGHVGCNLMFLVAYLRDKPELDDRVKVIS